MKTQNGFSLIELISVIVISAIVAGIIGSALSTGFFGYFLGASMNPLSNQATIAMTRMSNDLRNAASFTAINSSSVSFTDGANNTYVYDNTSCGANILCVTKNGGTPSTLATGVTTLTFSYYASTLAVTATASAVKAVNINLTLTGSQTNTIALINTIYARNA